MWTHLPPSQLHHTTNYGCAGGMCTGRYHNIFHAQAKARIQQIEQEIIKLKQDDPSMYYQGDIDELLDQHKVMTQRLKEPFA